MSITLRPYQTEAIEAVRSHIRARHDKWPIIHLPTGCGKTITALSIVHGAISKGHRVLWLAHRRELLDQPMQTWTDVWPDLAHVAGIEQASRKARADTRLVFASVATLGRRKDGHLARLDNLAGGVGGAFRVIVVDEAHHSTSPTWMRVLERLAPATIIGLTATPERNDSRHLGLHWHIAYSYPMQQAIESGYLVPPTIKVERLKMDLDAVDIRGSDYDEKQLSDMLIEAGIVDHTVDMMHRHAAGRKSLIFTVTVRQAEMTAAALTKSGIITTIVHGNQKPTERAAALCSLRIGDLDAIANCAVLTEGYDSPNIDCVVLARPTKSKPLYIQCVGRGLRLAPGKTDCLILDLAGASDEHDLLQTSALLQGKRRKNTKPTEPLPEGEGASSMAGMLDARLRPTFTWVRIEGVQRETWGLSCGEEGDVVLTTDGDRWRCWRLVGNDCTLLIDSRDRTLAQGYGEDFARKASKLTKSNAKWRKARMSDKQRAMLERWDMPTDGVTKGEASDIMSRRFLKGRAIKAGITEREQV